MPRLSPPFVRSFAAFALFVGVALAAVLIGIAVFRLIAALIGILIGAAACAAIGILIIIAVHFFSPRFIVIIRRLSALYTRQNKKEKIFKKLFTEKHIYAII